MEISKLAVLLANEHQSDQIKCYKLFPYRFMQCIRSRKTTLSIECQKSSIREDLHQNGSLSIS